MDIFKSKQKFLALLLTVLAAVSSVQAYEHNMISLLTPSTLDKGMFVYGIEHRFNGPLTSGDQLDTLFGADLGANIKMDFRYAITDKIDVRVSRERDLKEWVLGTTYSFNPSAKIRGIADLEFVSFKVGEDRRQNGYYALGFQYPDLFRSFTPAVNVAYDGYHETAGAGLGFEWKLGGSYSWIAEYFTSNNRTGVHNAWQTGVKLETFGHRFDVFVLNAHQMSARGLMTGTTESDDLYLGFRISRLLVFGD